MKNLVFTLHIINFTLKWTYCSTETCLPGPQGPPGRAGPPGDQGSPGEIGMNGKDGLPGKDGKNGLPGRIGELGERGLQGEVGGNGAKGVKGMQGPKGEIGPHGPPGGCGLYEILGDHGIDRDLDTLKIITGAIGGCLLNVMIVICILYGCIANTRKGFVAYKKKTDDKIKAISPIEERDTASYVQYRASTGSVHLYQDPNRSDEVPTDRDGYTGLRNRATVSAHDYQTTTSHEYQATTDNSQEYQAATGTSHEYQTANLYTSVMDQDLEQEA